MTTPLAGRTPRLPGGWFGAAIVFAVLVHALFIAALIWSDDGQTTVVRLHNIDGAQRMTSDGEQVIPRGDSGRTQSALDVPLAGTVTIILPLEVSTLPKPGGVDRIELVGADGAVLFADDFDSLDRGIWEVIEGQFEVEDGVLTTKHLGRNELRLRGSGFSNYDVVVSYRNSRGGLVGTHVSEGSGLFWHLELVRDFPNFVDVFKEGDQTGIEFGSLVRTSNVGPIESIAHMVSRPYPYMAVGLAVGVLLTLLLSQVQFLGSLVESTRRRLKAPPPALMAAASLATCAFITTVAINDRYYDFLPHVPDEVAYIYQANLLADFELIRDVPPVIDAFQFYSPSFLIETGDQWASFYPFGHPLVLAVGAFFGAVWVIPSLVGAGSVLLTFFLGRRLYDARTGLLAAGLLAASPFFLMQSSNFMSHNTAAFSVLATLLFLVKRERPILFGVIAGLMFGLGVNTRPLTMAALVLPFGVIILMHLRNESPRAWFKHSGAFVVGVGLMLVAMLAYNQGITGDPLTTTYSLSDGGSEELFGFRDGHFLDIGLRNVQAQMMSLLQVLSAWPSFVGLGLVLLPFLMASRNRWDYLLLASVLLPMAIYVGYRFSGLFGGPRYWFEIAPFLLLLSARGIDFAARLLVDLSRELAWRIKLARPPAPWAGYAIIYGAVVVLMIYGTGGWLTGLARDQNSPLVPYQASAIEGLFGVDARLVKLADEAELENALVLVEPCGFFGSYACYGSVFLRNLPDFNGDEVWALYLPETNEATIAAFPGRDVYVASWDDGGSLRVYEGN